MSAPRFADATAAATAAHLMNAESWPAWRDAAPDATRRWLESQGFAAQAGRWAAIPDAEGAMSAVVIGLGDAAARAADPFAIGAIARALPAGVYALAPETDPALAAEAALGWLLGSYRFDRYKDAPACAQLLPPAGVDADRIARIAAASALAQDLVNAPAGDLGPEQLEAAIRDLGARHGAAVTSVVGEDLLAQNYPMIHAVGRAAAQAPRLVDLRWGDEAAPKVTLVGKGVCFDTGGLDLKPSSAMLLMKKDMGGSAAAIALADMIMGAGLPVRLRLLVPAVENSVSASSFRPGDVLRSRQGLTVEIGNTDAEGRLVLADALTEADSENPDYLFDFATLTGAARVALGPDLPALFTNDDQLAAAIEAAGRAVCDPVWRLPLWGGYDADLSSRIADLNNAPGGGFAGAITAALFLRRFVRKTEAWAHFDLYAWRPKAKFGQIDGGACQVARGLYEMLESRLR